MSSAAEARHTYHPSRSSRDVTASSARDFPTPDSPVRTTPFRSRSDWTAASAATP